MKKRIIAVTLLAVMLATLLTGCRGEMDIDEPIKVAALKGPTGMGMTLLMGEEMKSKYDVSISTEPDEISAKLISGEADIAAVPLNLASVLYNKT